MAWETDECKSRSAAKDGVGQLCIIFLPVFLCETEAPVWENLMILLYLHDFTFLLFQ